MKRTAYLSIDMDYWDHAYNAFNCLQNLFQKLYTHDFKMWHQKYNPIVAVMNHQRLLPHVNERRSDLLINIDKHSDISSEENLKDLNCGSWVSYVKWRKSANYLWTRQHSIWIGNCNGYDREHYKENPWNKGHGWNDTKTVARGDCLDIYSFTKDYQLTGVGLCMSPDYIHSKELEQVFREIVKLYKIPYCKGRRSENYGI
jgi:hypothetical protein